MKPIHVSKAILALSLLTVPFLGPVQGQDAAADGIGERIQPGDYVTIGDDGCTLNFVFDGTGAKAGKVYIGTAAHCVAAVGMMASTPGVPDFGRVVWKGDHEDSEQNGVAGRQLDFALIEVLEANEVRIKAEVIGHDDRPTGQTAAGSTDVGDRLLFSGQGLVFRTTATTREERVGVLTYDSNRIYRLEGPIVFGDSGGPILHESGNALGVVSAWQVACCPSGGVALFLEGPTVQGIVNELDDYGYFLNLREA